MIIITGGAGFIGSCLLKYLNDRGRDDILIVDNLDTSSKWKNLLGKNYIDYMSKYDFIDFITLMEEPDMIDCIFHLGACSSTTEKDIDYLYENNYVFSKNLATFAVENDIRLIYASSAATYGMGENGFNDNEFYNLSPLNGYGFSKYLFDKWVIDLDFDEAITGFKFFNVFGPNEYHKGSMTSMVYKSYNQIQESNKVKLFKSNVKEYSDGEQLRDFVYVKDVCKILLEAYDKNIMGIYNLGTGKARSWNDLAKYVFESLKKDVEIEYVNIPEDIVDQYQNYTKANMNKYIKSGFRTKFTNLKESVDDYVNNYLVNNKYL